MSDFGDGKGIPDTIWYGYVQGMDDEWGYFSQAEIERLTPFAWEISKKNLPYSDRKNYQNVFHFSMHINSINITRL